MEESLTSGPLNDLVGVMRFNCVNVLLKAVRESQLFLVRLNDQLLLFPSEVGLHLELLVLLPNQLLLLFLILLFFDNVLLACLFIDSFLLLFLLLYVVLVGNLLLLSLLLLLKVEGEAILVEEVILLPQLSRKIDLVALHLPTEERLLHRH